VTSCYVDTETVGLDLDKHSIWEIAWAIEDGEIHSGFVPHSLENTEAKALEVNHYWSRRDWKTEPEEIPSEFEDEFHDTLHSYRRSGDAVTLVGANPSFDAYRLWRR
jgi:hypothetical protein